MHFHFFPPSRVLPCSTHSRQRCYRPLRPVLIEILIDLCNETQRQYLAAKNALETHRRDHCC